MTMVLAFLKQRIVRVASGILLLAVFVVIAGPLLQIGEWRPLESWLARAFAVTVLVLVWLGWELWTRARSEKAGAALMTAVVAQDAARGRSDAEALRLRERFEEAVGGLKGRRRGGASLYDLPWYLIIGAPGSGKTTALVNSGLHFPVDQRGGRTGVKGVGGTRNCDWWFTDEAVFVDTAGRYFSQDSDESVDSAGWAEFLSLLKKYRRRRPVNGVLVAISAADLMGQSAEERDEHVAAARRRLNELNQQFGIQLPVYLLVTKCDLIAGFTEYFDDLTAEGRAQVWGVTFPYEQTRNSEAAAACPAELDALVSRLNERLFERLEAERDVRRRARAFGFPLQLAALRDPLSGFVAAVFASTRFDRTIQLRGVYLTSGTQEGTPIDRVLGALGRRFAVDASTTPAGRGKAYFIERLLREVVIPESGLAGVNRRLEVKKAATQLAAYAAMLAVAVLGALALTVSYGRNASYLATVADDVARLADTRPATATDAIGTIVARLDALESVVRTATMPGPRAPWSMWWGLYQGASLGEDARMTYVHELNGPLLTRIAERFRQRLIESVREPLDVYDYLKGYLILTEGRAGGDQRLRGHVATLARDDWNDGSDAGADVVRHFGNLLDQGERIGRAVAGDAVTITQARNAIRLVKIPDLAYRRIRRNATPALTVREQVLGAEEVLRRRDGVSLSAPMLNLYTKDVFNELAQEAALSYEVEDLAAEDWVWGADGMPRPGTREIVAQLLEIYANDYIEQWDILARNIETRSSGSQAQVAQTLDGLLREPSPLKAVYVLVSDHTWLLQGDATDKPGGLLRAEREASAAGAIESLTERSTFSDAVRKRITSHFSEIHRAVGKEPGGTTLDATLGKLRGLQEQMVAIGPQVGGSNPLDAGTQRQIAATSDDVIRSAAALFPPIGAAIRRVADDAKAAIGSVVTQDFRRRYEQSVLAECRELVNGRYPLEPRAAESATLQDFGRIFGYGGAFDRFFETIAALVDERPASFVWRPGMVGGAPGPQALLDRLYMARQIRNHFFPQGTQTPELRFDATPEGLHAKVTLFRLEIDGQTIEYNHTPPRTVSLVWPGKAPGVVVSFRDGSPVPPSTDFAGAWALFRMLDDPGVRMQRVAPDEYRLTIQHDSYDADVIVRTPSVRSPFVALTLLRQFRCEI